MKKYMIISALLIIGTIAVPTNTINAQNVNVSININSQPAWGPVGYDYVSYYYMPAINCYYNVNSGLYHFYDRGMWVSARYLPYSYRNYDLYTTYKVVVNTDRPWLYNGMHRRDYARYASYRPQVIIRDSRDHRYSHSRQNRVVWYEDTKRVNNVNRHYTNSHNGYTNQSNRPSQNNSRPDNRRSGYTTVNQKENNRRNAKDNHNTRSTSSASSRSNGRGR